VRSLCFEGKKKYFLSKPKIFCLKKRFFYYLVYYIRIDISKMIT
jgi:hypothetical protein